MSEWRECKLGDVATFKTGKLNSNAETPTGIYPFFTCSPETLKIDNYAFDEEALLLAGNNANGVFSLKYYKGKFNAYQRTYLISIREINHHDYKFLFYSLKLQLSNLEQVSHGTATKYLTLPILNGIPFLHPPLPEQKAIAAVLSSLDDKIDLLHRQNKTLEAMAETLFKQWFVVEAREEWEEYAISDFAEHIKINIVPSKNMDTLFHHYSLPAYDLGQKPTVELGSEILSNKFKVVENSILVSKLNPRFPRIWAISSLHNQVAICSTEFQVLKPKNEKVFGYLYFLLHSNDVTEELTMASSGTSGSHQRVKPEDIFNVKTLLPSVSLAEKFSIQVLPNIKKIEANRVQIQTLETLRDNLLPKLMSGEVRVKLTPEETPCKPIMK
jgi:type I restriction enzyme S subunit